MRAAGLQLIPRPAERGSCCSVEGRIVPSSPAKGSGYTVLAYCGAEVSKSVLVFQLSGSFEVLPKPKSKEPILLATSEDVLSGKVGLVSLSGRTCEP